MLMIYTNIWYKYIKFDAGIFLKCKLEYKKIAMINREVVATDIICQKKDFFSVYIKSIKQ